MFRAGAWAINNFGASRVRIVNNTVWGGKVGAVILGTNRAGQAARDTVLANNVLDRVFLQGPVRFGDQRNNAIGAGNAPLTKSDRKVTRPVFVNEPAGDLRLRTRSPARRLADPRLAPRTDLDGLRRRARAAAAGAYR
jgi:hypothetical protein